MAAVVEHKLNVVLPARVLLAFTKLRDLLIMPVQAAGSFARPALDAAAILVAADDKLAVMSAVMLRANCAPFAALVQAWHTTCNALVAVDLMVALNLLVPALTKSAVSAPASFAAPMLLTTVSLNTFNQATAVHQGDHVELTRRILPLLRRWSLSEPCLTTCLEAQGSAFAQATALCR